MNKRNITIALLVSTFLAAIEVTVVSTAMPTIVGELGGLELISWVFAVYLLTSTVTTPIYGKLADLFGRKKIFILGSVLFLIGSMLCGLADSMTSLIWFRAVQGLGAGAMLPVTFTIIGDVYPLEQRGRMQGLISSIWGIAGLVGPLVGGFFVDSLTWRWIFYINVPFGVLSIILIAIYLKENVQRTKQKIDYAGAFTFGVSITALLFAVITGGVRYAWTSPIILGLFAVFAVFGLLFYLIQIRTTEPLIPLKLMGIRSIAVSNISGFFISAVLIALTTYIPMWVQGVMGKSATLAGLALAPMSIGWLIGAMISGKGAVKGNIRLLTLLGASAVALGCFGVTLTDSDSPYWLYTALMFVTGLGFGLAITVFQLIVQSSVTWRMRGSSTALNTFMRTLGQTIGIAIFGTWLNKEIARLSASGSNGEGAMDMHQLNKLLDPGFVSQASPDIVVRMEQVLAAGLMSLFAFVFVWSIVSVLTSLWMPRKLVEAEKGERT